MTRMGQQLWSWEALQFENIATEHVKTDATASSWDVLLEEPNRAWGYRIALPEEARAFIMWRARLKVLYVLGNILPGLAYLNGPEGFSFQIDTVSRRAEFRYLLTSAETVCVRRFDIPKLSTPLEILLELNVVTKICNGIVNGEKICGMTLPIEAVPALDAVTDIEILTTTSLEAGGGTIGYGELTLQCE